MRRVLSLLFVLGIGVSSFAGCTVETKASDVICVHDQVDICTDCARPDGDQRSYRGRHTCAADGKSFGPCLQCVPEEKSGPSAFQPVNVPNNGVPPNGPQIDAACNDKLTMVAGKNDPNAANIYAAVLHDGGFKIGASTNAPMLSPGAFVVTGRSLTGVYRTRDLNLVTSTFEDGLWATPTLIDGVFADGPPAIARWDGKTKVIFQSDSPSVDPSAPSVIRHDMSFEAMDWDPGTGTWLAGAPPGKPAVNLLSAPAMATVGVPGLSGSAMTLLYTDGAGSIFWQAWNGRNWGGEPMKWAGSTATPMTRAALFSMSGGADDLLAAWVGSDKKLYASTRKGALDAWSRGALVHADARPLESPNGIGLGGGRALVVYRDAEKKGWFTLFDPSKTPQWSRPAPLVAEGNPTLASTPQLADDTCGAEATLAYAEEGGKIAVMRFTTDAWKGPFVVPGITDVTFVTPALVH